MSDVLTGASREAGWVEGDAADLLGLTDAECRLIDLKISGVRAVARLRAARGWTQARLAEEAGTTQARIARMEGHGRGFSLDQILKAVFAMGGSLGDLEDLPPRPRMKAGPLNPEA